MCVCVCTVVMVMFSASNKHYIFNLLLAYTSVKQTHFFSPQGSPFTGGSIVFKIEEENCLIEIMTGNVECSQLND